tara:strand:- start:18 stop:1196 length:1179 start_codon:yes stop_codon:yes gene_type:complete
MRIGIYLGSFKPMHVGHEQTLTQAAQLNDILLFFPGFGAKGVKRGKRKNPSTGEKEDYYRPMDDQAMMTDDLGEKQFRLIKRAVEQIKKDNPTSPLSRVRIFLPGDDVEGFVAGTGPLSSALQIVGSIADHYVDNTGDMKNTYIPFLNTRVDNPEVRLYSDVTDVRRVTPAMLERFQINSEGIKGIYMKNFIPVGIVRGSVDVDYEYEPASFETEDISATDLRRRIRGLDSLEGKELEDEIDAIASLMPDMLSQEVKREFLTTVRDLDRQRRLSGGLFRSALGKLEEAKRPEKGTPEYSSYLEELMSELQFIKSGYSSRKKSGARYRKEASKIQDAYAELRRLRRKNDKMLMSKEVLSEAHRAVESGYNVTVNTEISGDFSVRDFLRNFKIK